MYLKKIIINGVLCVGLLGSLALSYAQLPKTTTLTRYCPAIKDIFKSKQNHWGTANGNFRNFETSFAQQLDKFVGAQWQGANLGYVTCVYKPHDPNLFYVTLLFNKLTYQPSTDKTQWTQSKQGSWMNCYSEDPKSCPFIIQPKPKKQDVYKEAERLRQEANPYDNPGF